MLRSPSPVPGHRNLVGRHADIVAEVFAHCGDLARLGCTERVQRRHIERTATDGFHFAALERS